MAVVRVINCVAGLGVRLPAIGCKTYEIDSEISTSRWASRKLVPRSGDSGAPLGLVGSGDASSVTPRDDPVLRRSEA